MFLLGFSGQRKLIHGSTESPPEVPVLGGDAPVGRVDAPYNYQYQFNLANTEVDAWSVITGSLPDGLQIDVADGTITGTPTQTETQAFTVQVTGDGYTAQTLADSIQILATLMSVTNTAPDGTVDSAFTHSYTVSGGATPLTFTELSMPPGLSLSSSGTLSGTPTDAGDFTVNFRVTDQNAEFIEFSESITVSGTAPDAPTDLDVSFA